MKNNIKLEEKLKRISYRNMSNVESAEAWNRIAMRMDSPSLIQLLLAKRKTMIPLLIGALIFASAGGTVAASNSAVPGDALFGVDRAVENVRLAFAGKGKAELKLKFAEERLQEVEQIIAEARLKASATSSATSTTATSTKSNKATSTATSTPRGSEKVALGISVAIDYLNDISADLEASGNSEAVSELESVIDRLENIANTDDVKVLLKKNGALQLMVKGTASSTASSTGVVKINTNGNKDRIEVREDGDRIRIELKDNGEVRIKSQSNDDSQNVGDDQDDENEDEQDNDRDVERERGDNRGKRGNLEADTEIRLEVR